MAGVDTTGGAGTEMTLFGLFEAQARRRPTAVAVVQGDRSWTYEEIERWSAVVAELMIDAGLAEGSKVLLATPNCVESAVSLLAAARIGALIVPINIRYRPAEFRALIDSLRPDCTVFAESFLTNPIADRLAEAIAESGPSSLGALRLLTAGSREWARPFPPLNAPVTRPPMRPQREDTPLICYWTSGTTGDPKGVVHTNRLVRNVWNWTSGVLGYTAEDVLVSTRPFYYISGSCWSLLASLIHGAKLVIAQRFDAAELLERMTGQGATIMLGGPSLYYRLLDSPLLPQHRESLRLRTGFFGGMPVKPHFVATVKEQLGMDSIVQVYGMTELLGFASSTLRTDSDEVTLNTVGKPLPGFEFQLRDPANHGRLSTEPGRPGELWVRGNVLAGYLRDGQITDACDEDGWFATGDLLSQRPDGNWLFHSRIRDMIKVRGENVMLSEVDDSLSSIPGVRRGVSFGADDDRGRDSRIEGMVELDGTRPVSATEIIEYCRSHLAPHKVPAAIWFLPSELEWPVTVSGKVQRRELVKIAADQQRPPTPTVGDAPRSRSDTASA